MYLTIDDVVTPSVCGALIHQIPPLVSWTRAYAETMVVLLRGEVLFGALVPRDHNRVRIAYRKLMRHSSSSTIPFVQVPVS